MNLPDLKQLKAVIDLCRKSGVKTIKVDNIELTLADNVPRRTRRTKDDKEEITEHPFSEEETLFWSSTGVS